MILKPFFVKWIANFYFNIMKFLNKTWARVLVGLIGGGLTAEIIYISTSEANRPMTTNLSLLYALIIYLALTFLAKRLDHREL